MLNSRHLAAAALAAGLSCVPPALAGDLAAAKRYADQSHPANCELIALQVRARSVEPDSPEYRALSDEFYRKAWIAEQRFAPEAKRIQEVEAGLTAQERTEVQRYSMELAEACVKQLRKDGQVAPPPGGPTKVAPSPGKVESATVAQ